MTMSREILVNPPQIIPVDQRVKYNTIVALTEMAEIALADIYTLAAELADQRHDARNDRMNRNRLITLAWSVVDQADLLRHLVLSEKEKIDLQEARDFLAVAKVVQEVRNWMRHIPQRVDAYVKANQPMPPALGALSFAMPVRARVPLTEGAEIMDADIIEYHTVVILNASVQRDVGFEGEPVKYERFKVPLDHFFLQAYGHSVPLDAVVSAMSRLSDALAAGVAKWLEQVRFDASNTDGGLEPFDKPAFQPGDVYRMVAKRAEF